MRPLVYSSNILFDFDAIVDIDIAIVKYFKLYLFDNPYVDTDILSSNDEYFFKSILIAREEKNPISLLLKPEFKNSADVLYNEIIIDQYEDILKLAPPLSLHTLMINALHSGFINCTILCKNQYEKQYIKKVAPDAIILDYTKDLKLDNFNCLYIKSFDFLLNHLYLAGKDVYILGYMYNMEPGETDIPKLEIFKKISKSIKLHIISPYDNKFIEPV